MLDTGRNICQSAPIAETAPSEAVARLSKLDCTTNRRGRPPITTERPWDTQGISRRTYYARLKPALPTQISYVTDQPRWFCVVTEYGTEDRLNKSIQAIGFETLYPRRWVAPVEAHRTSSGRAIQATSARLIALLPRYLLVRFDRSDTTWRQIATMSGVERVIGSSPEWPTPIPDAQIAKLRQGLASDDVLYPDRAPDAEAVKKRWVDMATALQALQIVERVDG